MKLPEIPPFRRKIDGDSVSSIKNANEIRSEALPNRRSTTTFLGKNPATVVPAQTVATSAEKEQIGQSPPMAPTRPVPVTQSTVNSDTPMSTAKVTGPSLSSPSSSVPGFLGPTSVWTKSLVWTGESVEGTATHDGFGQNNSEWPDLSAAAKVNQRKSFKDVAGKSTAHERNFSPTAPPQAARLPTDKARFPWAARMHPLTRNLHRVTLPEYLEDGTPKVTIPDHVLRHGLQNHKEYIIGQFYRCLVPPGGLVHAVLNRLWGRNCKIFVRKLSDFSYIFHIPDEATRKWVLGRGFWHVDNCFMFVAPWSASDSLSLPEISSIPLWVTLKNIPNNLYSIPGIEWIASGLGEPMLSHKPWLDPTMLGEAKIMVEVELDKPFPQKIAAWDKHGNFSMVDVEYSWLPEKCERCGQQGHKVKRCLLSPQTPNVVPNPEVNTEIQRVVETPNPVSQEVDVSISTPKVLNDTTPKVARQSEEHTVLTKTLASDSTIPPQRSAHETSLGKKVVLNDSFIMADNMKDCSTIANLVEIGQPSDSVIPTISQEKVTNEVRPKTVVDANKGKDVVNVRNEADEPKLSIVNEFPTSIKLFDTANKFAPLTSTSTEVLQDETTTVTTEVSEESEDDMILNLKTTVAEDRYLTEADFLPGQRAPWENPHPHPMGGRGRGRGRGKGRGRGGRGHSGRFGGFG